MKKAKYIITLFAIGSLTACSLDETNYSSLDTDMAYSTKNGYQSLINACYENIYYMYGKSDGIGPMEMGTDLWKNGSRTGSNGDVTNYNENLTPSTGVIRTIWNALYCIVGYCNTAIYYQNHGKFTAEEIKPMAAEAYFMRAFANFHIVEQWGNVVLNTSSFATNGVAAERAERSSEEDFYNQIISDLKFASENLPVTQAERGRATKKAALAMLAKAYMQRTRLYAEGSEKYIAYADSAFRTATELIDNAGSYDCGLYQSTADRSGNSIEWDDENNKDNKEFLFLEAIDHVNGYNPEGWNRGRTAQYYMMKSTQSANFGVQAKSIRYGRDNATVWGPTYYLLHDCFEPKLPKTEKNEKLINLATNKNDRTADTRFEDAFYYKYHANGKTVVKREILAHYKKDTLQNNPVTGRTGLYSMAKRTIKGCGLSGTEYNSKYPGANVYATGNLSGVKLEDASNDDALACYCPNWDLDTLETKYFLPLCVGLREQYDTIPGKIGNQANYSYYRGVQPSLKKFRSFKYAYTEQYDMMDIPVIRLTDIYLIAAEAAIGRGTPADGLPYLNAVRRHAAVSGDAAEMEVGMDCMNMDYILKERARELCGEQWRWYDLKRTGRLNAEYLSEEGKNPYITTFDKNKHIVRPIPQEFLDQIANASEFGTNGY